MSATQAPCERRGGETLQESRLNPAGVPPAGQAGPPCLVVEGITKTFPGVRALDNVSFEVLAGEIHAMVGENGAGKSTLMHTIAGVYQPDAGNMAIEGHPYAPQNEKDAQEAGVAIVFQERSLFPPLSVAENIFAGRQPVSKSGLIDFDFMNERTAELLRDLDVDIDPATLVVELSPSQQQLVEIAKALSQKVRILILDEPTSSLTVSEARHLFKILRHQAELGVAIVYVTHRLAEVFEIADRVTVLRDGQVTGVRSIGETDADELIHLEVGRKLSFVPEPIPETGGAPILLEVRHLEADPVTDASVTVRAGEIVTLAGLVGAGRSELCEAIFGLRKTTAGQIFIAGKELHPRHPVEAMNEGIGMVPEDRRLAGLFLAMDIVDNVISANMLALSKNGLMLDSKCRRLAQESVEQLNVVPPMIDREVMYFSGGNQQKVLLAKWLARKPKILIVDEPTKGVDVGAKAELYSVLRELARGGVALLVVSSDLPEVLAISHRIVVMSEGRTVGDLDPREVEEYDILQLATPQGIAAEGERQ
jgi:ribose transport system ATP-binding protein/rhamnose transport system ATP-binding protein